MALSHEHEPSGADHTSSADLTERSVVHEPFGVAQVIALASGIFFVVLGAVGLARAGLNDMTGEAVTVGPFAMTGLLALMTLLLGLIVMAGATGRSAARATLMTAGPLLIAAGIIALIQSVGALGWNDPLAIAYLVTGGVMLIGALVTPLASASYRRVSRI